MNIGIEENVNIVEFKVSDFGSGQLTLTQESEIDLFEALSSGGEIEDNTVTITIYPVKNTDWKGEALPPQTIVNDLRKLVAKLTHVISVAAPTAKINMFKGISSVTSEKDIATEVIKEDVLKQINTSIFNQFIDIVKGADLSKKIRIKLPRQSAAKATPSLGDYLAINPNTGKDFYTIFVESMEIPKEQSKLAWTDYEKGVRKNGNKGLDVTSSEVIVADTPIAGSEDSQLPF